MLENHKIYLKNFFYGIESFEQLHQILQIYT